MLRKIQSRIHSEKGFTLIELLVVILIIGILAAIALPAFLNQRQKGQDADAKAGARTAQTAMETCATDNSGAYTNCDKAALVAIEPSLGSDISLAEPTKAAATYTVVVTSATGKTFSVAKASGGITRSCSAAGGGCPSNQRW